MSVKALDRLGLAIVDAGYDWTYDMRKAYEDGIRQSRWKGLTDKDKDDLLSLDNWTDIVEAVEAKLKEKNA